MITELNIYPASVWLSFSCQIDATVGQVLGHCAMIDQRLVINAEFVDRRVRVVLPDAFNHYRSLAVQSVPHLDRQDESRHNRIEEMKTVNVIKPD